MDGKTTIKSNSQDNTSNAPGNNSNQPTDLEIALDAEIEAQKSELNRIQKSYDEWEKQLDAAEAELDQLEMQILENYTPDSINTLYEDLNKKAIELEENISQLEANQKSSRQLSPVEIEKVKNELSELERALTSIIENGTDKEAQEIYREAKSFSHSH